MQNIQEKLKSTNLKLFILLFLIVFVFIIFLIMYTKGYFSYYSELHDYRQQLIKNLTSESVNKPIFNNNDPYIGNPSSKIIIFEYADLSCESCKALEPVIKEVRDFYGDNNVMIIWKDFPITVAPNNLLAHEALHCANDQGKFIEYKDQLYANQTNFNDKLFTEIAKNLNLNIDNFTSCVKETKYQELVSANFSDALSMDITSAPTLFINNKEVQSGFNFQNLRSIIESTK